MNPPSARDLTTAPVGEIAPDSSGAVGAAPKLQVLRVSATGVRFAFDSSLLLCEGFRLSMPVQCVFSGVSERNNLIARPLVFLDQCLSKIATAESVGSPHECRELGDRHPREWLRQMGRLAKMTAPFDLPMPYYVGTRYAHLTLHCETHAGSHGRIQCELLIPDAETALCWMMRVNGVCGDDYQQLEHEVSLLHGSAWKALSDACRRRVNIWCKLKPHEQFKAYYNDADFNRSDEGLAGLVLTDQRLIFCKYHTRGKIPLNADNVRLMCKRVAPFIELYVQLQGRTSRMVKLRSEDYEALMQQLAAQEKHMQVVTA